MITYTFRENYYIETLLSDSAVFPISKILSLKVQFSLLKFMIRENLIINDLKNEILKEYFVDESLSF